jgi:hypothetical protein
MRISWKEKDRMPAISQQMQVLHTLLKIDFNFSFITFSFRDGRDRKQLRGALRLPQLLEELLEELLAPAEDRNNPNLGLLVSL